MAAPPDLALLDGAGKDALILSLMVRLERLEAEGLVLRAENAKLRERLGLPPKTPGNSSLPPSAGAKPWGGGEREKARAHRALHPVPDERREVRGPRLVLSAGRLWARWSRRRAKPMSASKTQRSRRM